MTLQSGTEIPPARWLVTGAAGFIGSHIVETLLRGGHEVVGLDNLSTGRTANLDDVRNAVDPGQWTRFRFIEGDITRRMDVDSAAVGVDFILHHAALGSVPLSLEDPVATHAANVTGFLNVLMAARQAGVRRVVYASSSAVYGDCAELPATEERIGRPLSPYALSKSLNEQYAAVFERCYGLVAIGLRYFNVFGPRQDPNGPYAAVIPRWIDALVHGRDVEIYGDGENTRDFCHVANIVLANLRAAATEIPPEAPRVFNVGLGRATSLNRLFELLRDEVARLDHSAREARPVYRDFRAGDVRHSTADTARLERWLGRCDAKNVEDGITETVAWFVARSRPGAGTG